MVKAKFYEISLKNGSEEISFVILGARKPSPEEASEFYKDDLLTVGGSNCKVTAVTEISYEEAFSAYDIDGCDNWPVFGAENPNHNAETIYRRCPVCGYDQFTATVMIEQVSVIDGEGRYNDKYTSEFKNIQISDEKEWRCLRCNHKDKGENFKIPGNKLKDAKIDNSFFSFHDINDKNVNVFYKGNHCIADAHAEASEEEVKTILANAGYYVSNGRVYTNSYSVDFKMSNGKHTVRHTVKGLSSYNNFDEDETIMFLITQNPEFERSTDTFNISYKITDKAGRTLLDESYKVRYKLEAKRFIRF